MVIKITHTLLRNFKLEHGFPLDFTSPIIMTHEFGRVISKLGVSGVHRTFHTSLGVVHYIILTPLSTEDRIERALEEEYLHYVLYKLFNHEVSEGLHSIKEYIECTDERFNALKFRKEIRNLLPSSEITFYNPKLRRKEKTKVCLICGLPRSLCFCYDNLGDELK